MPYDKLVKALRHCVLQNPCDGCPFYAGMDRPTEQCASMNWLAADAIEELSKALDAVNDAHNEGYDVGYWAGRRDYEPKWIPVTEELPSDFVSVQAHMTDAGNFPPVREAYVVNKNWFFPALKEFHPVDMWKRFDKPPKE